MEFALSEEQRLFADSLRGVLADRVTVDALRRHAESGIGFDADLWQALVELGLPGLLVPERFGGAGLGVLDAAVAAEMLGAAATFAPFAGSVVMATLAFIHGATEEQQAEWLPRIASGEVRFGVGIMNGGRTEADIDAGEPTHFLVYLPDGKATVLAAEDALLRMHRSIDRTRPVTDVTFDPSRAITLNAAKRLVCRCSAVATVPSPRLIVTSGQL